VKPESEKKDDQRSPLHSCSPRHTLTRHEPRHIEAFSRALRDLVADFRQLFFNMFNRLRAGEAGPAVAGVARKCFQVWCERSYIVPPDSLHRQVERALVAEDASAEKIERLLSAGLGFPREAAAAISETLYARREKKPSRMDLLWPLYNPAIWNFATETAHVHAARLLLCRMGLDQGISESEMADFAPSVFKSGEFDWWRVVHREALTERGLQRVQSFEEQLDVLNKRLLRLFSVYDLSGVDLDIWRDIYQYYLPAEERQQLGGFYTPQELVDLTLDLANYKPEVEKLCERSLIDPASGSGAFVVSAVQRLLEHLNDKALACHGHLHARGLPDWERAFGMLQIIGKNIHAMDIHPFATFLTFINLLLSVLPLYAQVRPQRRDVRLDDAISLGDSLLTPGENEFNFVVGNPPWGGILKGRLAPIFDEHYKVELARKYRDTYTGKLDVYGLFYDLALQWLKPGGTVALVTQGSFIDKDWAAPHTEDAGGEIIHIMGLRRKLAERASLRYLIDLNPFGKVFFGAMSIPCIGVFDKRPAYDSEQAVVLLSSKKSWPKGLGTFERRAEVVSLVRRSIELVEQSGAPLEQDFVTAFWFPLSRLRDFGGSRWLMAPKEFKIRARSEWPRVVQLLEPSQGLTVGGKGCLSIFLMTEACASELGLEKTLLHRIIKGHETTAWRPERGANLILYPYACDKEGRWRPAFACKNRPVIDALDFEHPADKFEQEWLRKYGINPISIKRLFEHRRDALGLVRYPKAAEYLLKFYEQLSGRTFKKRNVRDFGRAWYEFIWPRDAEVIFGKPKIISPRLTPHLRFALDQEGIGIQDSCVCLAVSDKTRQAYGEFRGRLSNLVGREVKMSTMLRYLLAFLNSSYAQELLTTGHRPRPGDVFQVSDELLEELSVPVCRTRDELQQLLGAVDACMIARTPDALERADSRLNNLVSFLYSKG
jgi:hypothetical protein